MKSYEQGKFIPRNPEKYAGDVNNIVYRSSWEKRLMIWMDKNPSILKWVSEEIVIPYVSPLDQRVHRYFPDFVVLYQHRDGTKRKMVVEVKPHAQTIMPEKKTKTTKRYLNEVATYAVNQAKWEAAEKWCKERGFDFQVITEKMLFGNGK